MKTVLNDRYELAEEIGRGGMAITYRAHDTVLDRTVAVKVMREQFGSDPEFVERFRREAQAAASLSHQNIAGVYDTGADGGRHYIVMEFVEGENLEQRLRRRGPLDPLAAIDVALQVVAALETAHRRGIVHRDIKPHNVLINAEGRVKVTDFGIAKAVTTSSQTETGMIMGSVHYFSPEQARGEAVGPQSDLYSLGVVLFEAVTGKRPFEGQNPIAVAHKQIYDPPPLPSEYRAQVPPELESIILKCLEKPLSRRYANASELRGYLEDARERLAGGRARRRMAVALPRRPPRRSAAWLGMIGGIIAVGVAAYLLAGQRLPSNLVSVPDLSALDPPSAQRLLADAHLTLRISDEAEYAEVPAGLIARQTPRPLARVEPQSVVIVWLSLGARLATVPDLVHLSRAQAVKRLRLANLEAGPVADEYSEDIPAGRVISSDPAAGERVDRQTRVALVISKGKPPVTPPGAEGTAEAIIPYTVPQDAGPGQLRVRVEATDDRGKRTLYAAEHMAGDQLPTLKVKYSGRMSVRVLINEREVWSRVFGGEAPMTPEAPPASPAPTQPPPQDE